MLIVALLPLGDTLIMLRIGGTKAAAFGIHFATAVVVLLNAALLFVSDQSSSGVGVVAAASCSVSRNAQRCCAGVVARARAK